MGGNVNYKRARTDTHFVRISSGRKLNARSIRHDANGHVIRSDFLFNLLILSSLDPPPLNLKSTMHHCLDITEILHIIFKNFHIYGSRYNLLSLAFVSKAFHEPALDLLWELQGSLLPLIKTFPADLWKEEGNPSTFVSFLSVSFF
jgi:hypothetical protein